MSYFTDSIDDKVVAMLKNGAVGLLPSDTIYGLSCAALNEEAVRKIHSIKGRNSRKPFIILISDLKMLSMLNIDPVFASTFVKYWPGQLSAILPALDSPKWLRLGLKSLAIRWPADKRLQALISRVGPIISTSANLEGQKPAKNVQEAETIFGNRLDFYVDVGELNNAPSTLVRVDDGKILVLRPGSVKINT